MEQIIVLFLHVVVQIDLLIMLWGRLVLHFVLASLVFEVYVRHLILVVVLDKAILLGNHVLEKLVELVLHLVDFIPVRHLHVLFVLLHFSLELLLVLILLIILHFRIFFLCGLHGILHLLHLGLRVNLILILFLVIFKLFLVLILLLLLILLVLVLVIFRLSRGRGYKIIDELFLFELHWYLVLCIDFFLLLLELLLVVLIRDKGFLICDSFHALHLSDDLVEELH